MPDFTIEERNLHLTRPHEAEERNREQRERYAQAGWEFDGTYLLGSEPLRLSPHFQWLVQPHYTGGWWKDTLGNEICISKSAVNVYRKAVQS